MWATLPRRGLASWGGLLLLAWVSQGLRTMQALPWLVVMAWRGMACLGALLVLQALLLRAVALLQLAVLRTSLLLALLVLALGGLAPGAQDLMVAQVVPKGVLSAAVGEAGEEFRDCMPA